MGTVQINSQSSRSSRETSFLDFTSTWKTAKKKGSDLVCCVFQWVKCYNFTNNVSNKVRHTHIPKQTLHLCGACLECLSGYSCSVSCRSWCAPARTSKSGSSGVDLWELQHKILSPFIHSLPTNQAPHSHHTRSHKMSLCKPQAEKMRRKKNTGQRREWRMRVNANNKVRGRILSDLLWLTGWW